MFDNAYEPVKNWGETVIWTAAILTALGVIWKKFIQPLWNWSMYAREIILKLDKVLAELAPNGGGSLRDAIDRIASKQESDNQIRNAVLLNYHDAVFKADENGHYTWVNRTFSNLVNRDREDLLGIGWMKAIKDSIRLQVVDDWLSAVRHRREFEMDIIFQTKSGKDIPMTVRTYPITTSENITTGFIGVCSHVTVMN